MQPDADEIHIRRAQKHDLDAIERLEMAAFSHDQLPRDSLRYYIGAPSVSMLVAQGQDGLCAYALVAFHRRSIVARLYSIAVAAECAGRGTGRKLMSACEASARLRGAHWMRLEVRPDNAGANALYHKLGYRRFAEVEDFYEDGSNALRLEKPLTAEALTRPRPRPSRM
ncbi:MAG: GNAT family N-acetyltransferase [Hyphomicrobiales bacterium]|nr:GNAT family N-acetyltransferase [Hyphomicrobiales bacterium]